MSGVNKVILVGRLGKDPEVRHLESGVTVANFSLATSETYKEKSSGEKKENTEWHRVVLWRRLAEIAESYLRKGKLVYIEGKLRTRSWEKDGVTKYTTEVEGDVLTMLGGASEEIGYKATNQATENSQETIPNESKPSDDAVDDLPF